MNKKNSTVQSLIVAAFIILTAGVVTYVIMSQGQSQDVRSKAAPDTTITAGDDDLSINQDVTTLDQDGAADDLTPAELKEINSL